jgi:hypothetical protein
MNFIAGLFLIVSGAREKEAFWVFSALLSENDNYNMEGLEHFFRPGCEMTLKY